MNRENIQLTARIVASDTEALYAVARSKGINMPHPALSIFKSTLCELEKANANGVRLGSKATEAAVSTLIGCQINRNHLRAGNVLGHIIDAEINKDKEIDITCIFFKDIYSEEWDEAQRLFAQNKLTMSFELSADVESQDKLADGTKRLNDYYFTGAGLLFGVKPACKKARVFEMAAKKLQEKLSMERQSLIFANNQNSQKSILEVLNLMADEVKKIEEVKEVVDANMINETPDNMPTCEPDLMNELDNMNDYEADYQEADKLTYQHKQNLSDSDFAVVVTVKNKVTGEPRKIRKFPINDAAHVRNALARLAQPKAQETLRSLGVSVDSVKAKILRRAKELNMTELLQRHQAEEPKVVEAQKTCPNCNTPLMDNQTCAKCNTHQAEVEVNEAALPPEVIKIMKELIKNGTPNAEALKKAWEQYKKTQKASEEIVAQPVMEQPVSPAPDNTPSTTVREENEKVTVVTDPSTQTQTITEEKTTTVTVDDVKKIEKTEKTETVYSQAQLDEVKAGYEKQIAELKEQISSKDKEVETLKAAQVKVEEPKVEVKVEAKEEPVVLATGHKKVEASEDSNVSPIAKILKRKISYRK